MAVAKLEVPERVLRAAVREALEPLIRELDDLRSLLQAWEPRVVCPQCGQRYAARACGPSHALVWASVRPNLHRADAASS